MRGFAAIRSTVLSTEVSFQLILRPWALQSAAEARSEPSRRRIRDMPRITRERMIEAIRELPEDASVDDAIERLVFLAKIEEGLAQLDRGEGIPHEEVKRRLGL